MAGAWCVFEDLNVVRRHDDRLNSQVNIKEMTDFNNFINDTSLIGRVNLLGPKPFRVFKIWMDEPDFFRIIEDSWMKEVWSSQPDCRFRDRLKNIKECLRVWSKDKFGVQKERVGSLEKEAMRRELEAEKRDLLESKMSTWLEARKQWEIVEKEHENMFRQKSRIRWDVEGDENSKFFHAFIRRRNNKFYIRGLMVDEVW
ncbi:hypothetical protein Tco_0616612 [Tanacetum coccineum]